MWFLWCFFYLKFAMGSGQAGPDEGATKGPQVSHRRGVLEAADILCQWCFYDLIN